MRNKKPNIPRLGKSKSNPKSTSSGKPNSELSPLEDRILRYIGALPKGSIPKKKLLKKMSEYYSNLLVKEALAKLTKKKFIFEHQNGNLALFPEKQAVTFSDERLEGVIEMNSTGNAYVRIQSEENHPDVFISQAHLGRSFHGDKVEIALTKFNRNGKPEGQVVQVIKRATELFIGRLVLQNSKWYVITDKATVTHDFLVAPEATMDAKAGERVIVKWMHWNPQDRFPTVEVIDRLSGVSNSDAEMISILVQHGFPTQFPPQCIQEAAAITLDIPDSEVKKRRDMRQTLTFTIDPFDAKDFDDAISYQELKDGIIEIGIHIADVAHYIRPGSALDKEAYHRATSVYLVDRVNPMLPEHISNLVCSLRPNEDKCTFSAVFQFSPEGEIVDRWYGRTLIHSDKRYTYDEAKEELDNPNSTTLNAALQFLNTQAKRLKAERMKAGAIAFESQELKFKLDSDGRVLGIVQYVRHDAHFLIEEFMLLANKEVARLFNRQVVAKQLHDGVYRVHDSPDMEKLQNLSNMAGLYGYSMDLQSPKRIANSINALLAAVNGKPEQSLLETLALRSMSKAKYTTQNIGHYGLAFEDYTHFTSPIRRYPDIMVHRILSDIIEKRNFKYTDIEQQCLHCSERERKAMESERESQKVKQVEFLQGREGEEFEAVVSGVANFGMFVQLVGLGCEGLVPIDSLEDDVYYHDDKKQALVGRYHGNLYRIGSTVRARLVKADTQTKKINFTVV